MAREAVDEAQREVGQRADVEVDDGELLAAIEIGGESDQPEARVVDHELRLDAGGAQRRIEPVAAVARCQIHRNHQRPRMAACRDGIGHRH